MSNERQLLNRQTQGLYVYGRKILCLYFKHLNPIAYQRKHPVTKIDTATGWKSYFYDRVNG